MDYPLFFTQLFRTRGVVNTGGGGGFCSAPLQLAARRCVCQGSALETRSALRRCGHCSVVCHSPARAHPGAEANTLVLLSCLLGRRHSAMTLCNATLGCDIRAFLSGTYTPTCACNVLSPLGAPQCEEINRVMYGLWLFRQPLSVSNRSQTPQCVFCALS